MTCEEIMKRTVECLQGSDTVETAARKMRDANIGFLPVCDSSLNVLGTLTDRDIAIRVVADARPNSTPAKEVMTAEVIACRPSDSIRKAEELMSENQKSRMICTDETGRLVGVISLSDIAQVEEPKRAAQTMREVTEREAHATSAR